MSAKLRIVSWVLLTIVSSLTLLGSLGSVYVAYVADAKQDQIGPMSLSELAEGRGDLEIALRARRGTAAGVRNRLCSLVPHDRARPLPQG